MPTSAPTAEEPFRPGEIIEYAGRRYQVVKDHCGVVEARPEAQVSNAWCNYLPAGKCRRVTDAEARLRAGEE